MLIISEKNGKFSDDNVKDNTSFHLKAHEVRIVAF